MEVKIEPTWKSKLKEEFEKLEPVLSDMKIDIEALKLVEERKLARQNKDWKKSDELRDKIAKLGYEVKDTAEGQEIQKIG